MIQCGKFLFVHGMIQKDFDILFIDIQMKKMDGIKMAKRIRESDNKI